ncbi:MAG: hypothetical protein H6695_00605 [Deferribacteres bacterium]|nr:hypothetical protein [candidate division KSB1 bacterium]MCB9508649.1 hypothetical protein [Deferribacteres bacterium]
MKWFKSALVCGLLVAGGVQSAFAQWRDFSSVSENIKSTDNIITEMRLQWVGDYRQVKAQLQGTMEILADPPAIKSISPGGSFALEEKNGNQYRKLLVESDSKGALSYRYEVQAENAVFSSIAQQWFAALFLEIVREAGINSRQRTQGLVDRYGENAVFQEIDQIERERSKRFYYERLLEQETLSDSTLLKIATRIQHEFAADANLRIIISDMTTRPKLDTATWQALLKAVAEVNNDATRANLLIDMAAALPADSRVQSAYRTTASGIRTEVEKKRALSALK